MTVVSIAFQGRNRIVLLFLYIAFIGTMTLWYREAGEFAALLSGVIEGIQYVMGLGLCELDDITSNSIGELMGLWVSAHYHTKQSDKGSYGNEGESGIS